MICSRSQEDKEAGKFEITQNGNCFYCDIHEKYNALVQRIAEVGGKELLLKCRVKSTSQKSE